MSITHHRKSKGHAGYGPSRWLTADFDCRQLLITRRIPASIFDERNAAVKKMIAQVIATCRARGRKIGICGQAPSDYPEFAQFLVEQGIDSISLNPDTVLTTTLAILEQEGKTIPFRA